MAADVWNHRSGGRRRSPFGVQSVMGRSGASRVRYRVDSMEYVGSHFVGKEEVSTPQRCETIHPDIGSYCAGLISVGMYYVGKWRLVDPAGLRTDRVYLPTFILAGTILCGGLLSFRRRR